jgi:hypothetical protein
MLTVPLKVISLAMKLPGLFTLMVNPSLFSFFISCHFFCYHISRTVDTDIGMLYPDVDGRLRVFEVAGTLHLLIGCLPNGNPAKQRLHQQLGMYALYQVVAIVESLDVLCTE